MSAGKKLYGLCIVMMKYRNGRWLPRLLKMCVFFNIFDVTFAGGFLAVNKPPAPVTSMFSY